MTATRIEDLTNVEIEHLLGLSTGLPLVKIRAESTGTVLVGQVEPAQAREIALNLLTAAARAEYEHDLAAGSKAFGLTPDFTSMALHAVRAGEISRHTGGDA